MFVAAAIVSSVLAVVLAASAMGKLTKADAVMEIMTKVAVPPDKLWLLAAAELAGSLGLVFGLFWWPIGVAAAIGVILYFLGAAVAHLRVNTGSWRRSGSCCSSRSPRWPSGPSRPNRR